MKGKHLSWITIWLLVVCILLVVTGTYAMYSSVKYAPGVTVAKARTNREDVPLSSNYLTLRTTNESAAVKMAMASRGSNPSAPVSVPITVCNFPRNDRMKFHKGAFSYQMQATLCDINGNALTDPVSYQDENGTNVDVPLADLYGRFSLGNTTFSGASIQISGSFAGGTYQRNNHTLTCTTPELFNVVSILMEVVPSCTEEACSLSGWVLRDRLQVLLVDQSNQDWTGGFIESKLASSAEGEGTINLSTVDAFNYVISGTAEKTITINWKKEVELSKWSMEDLVSPEVSPEVIVGEGDNRSISVSVGGEGKPTSYRLQFYRADGFPDEVDATQLETYVWIS